MNSKQLQRALKIVSPASGNNRIIPVLENAKLIIANGKAEVTATNLEITISTSFDCEGVLNILIPFDEISDIASKTSEIEISDKIDIKETNGDGFWDIGVPVDVSHFPTLPEIDFTVSFDADCDFFYSLSKALKTTANDDVNGNVLVDIKTENISIVSFNGVSLYVDRLNIKSPKEIKITVPPAFIEAAKKFQDSKVFVSEKYIMADDGTTKVYCRLIDTKPLIYEPVLNRSVEPNFTAKKSDWIDCISKIETIRANQNGKYRDMNIYPKDGETELVYLNSELNRSSRDKLKCKSTTDVTYTKYNAAAFKTCINQIDDEDINMRIEETYVSITSGNTIIFIAPLQKN